MNLWLATTNKGKLDEFRNLFIEVPIEIKSTADLGAYAPPPENGDTFEDNARIKARSLKAVRPGEWVVADDSGLEVEGLGGLPGVHSARYAGNNASDAENTAKVLKMVSLRSPHQRAARFVCCLVAYDPQGQEHVVTGEARGEIAKAPRGTSGFGYDAIFIPNGESKTFAELGPAVKNRHSHRSEAIRALRQLLPGGSAG